MARTLTGLVTSDARNKTITVSVASRETHPIYRKQYTATRKYAAHDENNTAKLGDKVVIAETRRLSKTKSWRLDRVLEKAHGRIDLKPDVTETTEAKETI